MPGECMGEGTKPYWYPNTAHYKEPFIISGGLQKHLVFIYLFLERNYLRNQFIIMVQTFGMHYLYL